MVSNCELPSSTVYQSVCAAGRNTAPWAYFSCNTAFDICAFHLGACSCQYTFQKVDPKSVLFFFSQEKHSEVLNSRWLTARKPLHAKSRNNGISFSYFFSIFYFSNLLICQIFLFTTARTDTFRCLVLSDCQSKVVGYSTDAKKIEIVTSDAERLT